MAVTVGWVHTMRTARTAAPFVLMLFVTSIAAGQVPLPTKRPLELRLAEDEPGPDLVGAHVVGEARIVYVRSQADMDDRDMQGASVVKGPNGRPAVQVHLRPSGVRKFNSIAKVNQLKTLAIIYRGRVISTPVIDGELVDDLLDIVGNFYADEASSLAKALSNR